VEEEQEFIQSGILELYVIGDVTADEKKLVEERAVKNPAVRDEISAIEYAMEKYASLNAVHRADELQVKIMENILPEDEKGTVADPAVAVNPAINTVAANHVVTAIPDQSAKIKKLYFALAACVALLIISTAALYSAHNDLGNAKEQIFALSQDKEKYAQNASYMTKQNEELQTMADMPSDPDWKTVKLAGTKMDPTAKMVVYWHTSGQHVMVDTKKMGLPANDELHQYQLWALVNGKPVDLGVFDAKADSAHILVKMKEIAGAQAFAVTLEKRGGSVNPTMEQMIAMGAVTI